jgi:hypothetical protein
MKSFAAIAVACLSLLVLASCASGGREPYTGAELGDEIVVPERTIPRSSPR